MTIPRHLRVPRDPVANRVFRHGLLKACLDDPSLRAGVMEACKRDILFYVNAMVYQFNPNAIPGGVSEEVGPFITWQFQEEAIATILDCIDRRKDLLIEKSREMGISWLCLLVMDWLFLFHPWKDCLIISRSADAVDKPFEMKALLPKLDFVHQHLPDWMARGRVERRDMMFFNPLLKSTISGEASTGKAGVGGRAKIMFIDEFSQIREDYKVLGRTSDTSGCRIFNGTHIGTGTAFYDLSRREDMKKLVLHWTQHPDKRRGLYRKREGANDVEILDPAYAYPSDYRYVLDGRPAGGPYPGLRSPWYDEQCRRKGSARDVAMDLDIDPSGSKEQFFDALRIEDLIRTYARPPFWVGDLLYDRESGEPIEMVRSDNGKLKLWLWPDGQGRPPVGRYGVGADVATGVGATPSTAAVFDWKGEKVVEYADPFIEPRDYAIFLVALARLFKGEDGEGAALGWERNGPGAMTTKKIIELRYLNIYWKTPWDKVSARPTESPGWWNENQSSQVLLEDYRAALYAGRAVNRSEAALRECLEYGYTSEGIKHTGSLSNKEVSGARENHGDQVIADAIAWMMVKDRVRPRAAEEQQSAPKVGSLAWRRELAKRDQQRQEQWA